MTSYGKVLLPQRERLRRKISLIALAFALLSTSAACGGQEQGTIVDGLEHEDRWDQILVVPDIDEEALQEKSSSEWIEAAQDRDGAYYGVDPDENEDLDIGMQVLMKWSGTQEDSLPPQREADSIVVLSE
ncbi:DUF3221 domain-containing protein [Alkalicoccus chagannorensis]|uniref:DUF3221 domain-containing protein n=1 Tax=Alkalicoccus chagannorensis TaxID=427072 RepID=UPI0004023C69|nr:DUF3221 domain-containing protein [Alkalicoccus chagannorensis]